MRPAARQYRGWGRRPSEDASGDRGAATLPDLSARGVRLGQVAQLMRHGPVVSAERRRLDGLFGQRPRAQAPVNAPAQRLVVNTGDTSFPAEVKKKNGWIVAKDIDIALLDGGYGQKIVEFGALSGVGKIGSSENVYLQGHGSPGELGDMTPRAVGRALKPVLPDKYAGTIYSLSCSAGVPKGLKPSGVEGLARELNLKGLQLEGAGGVALNHPTFKGAHRVVKEEKYDSVEHIILDKIKEHDVNGVWKYYVDNVWGGSLLTAAVMATALSETFYIDLIENLDKLGVLLPVDQDTTVVNTY